MGLDGRVRDYKRLGDRYRLQRIDVSAKETPVACISTMARPGPEVGIGRSQMIMPSGSTTPGSTTAVSVRPRRCSGLLALGKVELREERQEGVGDLLWALRVGVVARVLDHLVAAQTGW
jgi:hypothetical protein